MAMSTCFFATIFAAVGLEVLSMLTLVDLEARRSDCGVHTVGYDWCAFITDVRTIMTLAMGYAFCSLLCPPSPRCEPASRPEETQPPSNAEVFESMEKMYL
eukprot:TRINITY_DN34433_c0_g1_i1.p1 TRINITY_DN34433_c0_g1~~TRINITY_DN34433_c0_g1_i1.p1  ORF type:complete len:101 (-),score=24.95 TRINITY_DN34433_c0_g1_i1:147-449(-)